MSKWKKKLNVSQRKHLKEMGVTTLKEVRENVVHQETNQFPCQDYVDIGRRLGIKISLNRLGMRNSNESG